jgi:replicative DNA helicase
MPKTSEVELPFNEKAERAVLGLALNQPEHLLTLLAQESSPELFHDERHRLIYSAMCSMDAEGGVPIDIVALDIELGKRGALQRAGGSTYVSDLTTGVMASQNLTHYLRELKELQETRRFVHLCQQGISAALEGEGTIWELTAQHEQGICELAADERGKKIRRVCDTVELAMSGVFNPAALSGQAFTTGISELDTSTFGGLRKGEYWIYGALPSRGKTSAARQCAAANVLAGVPTLVFSIEMSEEQWIRQTVATHARVAAIDMRNPRFLGDAEKRALRASMEAFLKCPLLVDESSPLNVRELVSRARLAIRRDGVQLVIVDYLQTLDAPGRERMHQVANASAALRDLAKTERVAVLALSQLSRPRDINAPPQMTQLKESGDIEAHAHTIVLLYLPEDERGEPRGDDQLIIAKQRFGRRGPIDVHYSPEFLTFGPRAGSR